MKVSWFLDVLLDYFDLFMYTNFHLTLAAFLINSDQLSRYFIRRHQILSCHFFPSICNWKVFLYVFLCRYSILSSRYLQNYEQCWCTLFHHLWCQTVTPLLAEEVKERSNTWQERLRTWKKVLRNEQLNEQLDSLKAKYVVEFDMREVENSLRKDVREKLANSHGVRAQWISKRWWRYRPNLPYTYFLQKLDSSEVYWFVFFLSFFCPFPFSFWMI